VSTTDTVRSPHRRHEGAIDRGVEIPLTMSPAEVEVTAANLIVRARQMLDVVLGSAKGGSPHARWLVDVDKWLSAKRVAAPTATEVRLSGARASSTAHHGMPMHLSVAVLNAASAFARTLDREVPPIETADVVQDLRDACTALLEVMRP
jgi:hypothetical protein